MVTTLSCKNLDLSWIAIKLIQTRGSNIKRNKFSIKVDLGATIFLSKFKYISNSMCKPPKSFSYAIFKRNHEQNDTVIDKQFNNFNILERRNCCFNIDYHSKSWDY